MSMKKAIGFTLVELVITLAVVSVLVGIAAPSFRGMLATNRLASQTNELIAGINLARSEAIKRNRSVLFCRAANAAATACATGNSWEHWIVLVNDTNNVIRRDTINNAISVSSHTGNALTNATLRFSPDGQVHTSAGLANERHIRLCTSDRASGNVRLLSIGPGNRLSTDPLTGDCP